MNEDCKVCQQLIKQKHKNDIIWKIACLVFAALAIVLGILYFGSGKIITESEINIENTGNNNETSGDNSGIIIGSEGSTISGTVEQPDYTPIICISVIFASAIVAGGIIYAHNSISQNKNNN